MFEIHRAPRPQHIAFIDVQLELHEVIGCEIRDRDPNEGDRLSRALGCSLEQDSAEIGDGSGR